MQCYSHAVGHMKRCDETIAGDETALHKMCNIAHFLLVIGKDGMRLPFTKYTCHSQAVGHGEGCDEGTFYNMCNITHKLLAIEQYVMPRLPFTKCAISLTRCWL